MITALLGKKLSMTQLWDSAGICHAVTVIETGPCQVVQVKTSDGKDGYDAVQIGFDEFKVRNEGKGDSRANKPTIGHFKRHESTPQRIIREVPAVDPKSPPAAGTNFKVDEVFKDGEKVDVIGTSKGRGFQGTVKRHNFTRGPKTHGSKNYREPGSTGCSTSPGHVIRGKRMPGQMGNKRATVRNLKVVKIEGDRNLLYVSGAIPGARGSYVLVRKAAVGG